MGTLIVIKRFIVLLFFILLVTACTSAGHVKPLSADSNSDDPNYETQTELKRQSEQLRYELKRRGLLYGDAEANEYITRIGNSLAPEFMRAKQGLNFYIIKNATANAMALPNGDIYINIGLLSVVENEDQLAAILAHEISHVIQRHSLKSKLNRDDTILAANIAEIFLLGTGLGYASAIDSLASFSREQEKEADLLSLRYLHKAGYDLTQAPGVFRLFQSLPEYMTTRSSVYSSHPDNLERVDYLEAIVKDSYSGMINKARKPEIFNTTRAKLVESNVQIRLSSHQYKIALLTLDRAESYYKKAALIQYYRGEAYRLMAKNPNKAAEESEWLAGDNKNDQDLDYFNKTKQQHRKKAESYYLDALQMKPELAQAHKGLGLLDYSAGNYKQAINRFETYLELADKPDDRLFIKRMLRNSKRKAGM